MRRVLAWSTLLLLVLSFVPNFATSQTQQTDDTAFQAELEKGKDLFRKRKYDDALKSFKRANEMREKKCAVCYAWMAESYYGLESYKNVISAADKAAVLAGNDTQLLLKAYNNKGLALQALADRKDQEKLQAAETVFRLGLALPNAPAILRYNLGVTLCKRIAILKVLRS